MNARIFLAAGALFIIPPAAHAQNASNFFEKAVYITCKEAQAMESGVRRTLAVYLAEHAARYRGVTVPDDERGAQLAFLVRGGCTLAPDAYLFTVIDRAILAEIVKLPKR